MINKLSFKRHIFPVLILCLLNTAIFFNYWIGYSTPPWDFLGGGQVEQFRFYKDGSFFDPPSWFPYAWFGIPEYQLLQDGGWFIPVALVAEFFIWSPPNAARTQAFIILFGAIGAYFLASRYFKNLHISLFSGLLYTFVPVFYSNAQHYSVVRSAAFLPWLLFIFHKESILKSKIIPFCGTLIIFQCIVGSYPGNLIATFYTTIIYIFFQFFNLSNDKFRYLISVAWISISACLMGLLRYLPSITNLSSLPSDVGNQAGVNFKSIVYLIYPFIGDNLPWSDPTLRSLFIGPTVFGLLFFMNFKDQNLRVWLTLLLTSIVFMMQNQLNEFIRNIIPFANISRFSISDWRNTFNLALILITCFTLNFILDLKNKINKVNLIISLFVGIFIIFLGITYGFSMITTIFYAGSYFILLALIMFRRIKHFLNLIIVFTMLSCYAFVSDNNFSWSTTVKEQYFNIYKEDFTSIDEIVNYPLNIRPDRKFIDKPPLNSDQYKNDQRYNKFWLTGEFGALGYHNIKDIPSYSSLFLRLEKKDDPLIKFLSKKSQQITVTKYNDASEALINCIENLECNNNSGIKILQLEFNKESEKFSITSNTDFVMIQNEMYNNVWNGKICDIFDKCQIIKAIPILDSLRGWNLPKGEYIFETYALTPNNELRWTLFYLGFFLSSLLIPFNLKYANTRVKNDSGTS